MQIEVTKETKITIDGEVIEEVGLHVEQLVYLC